MRLSINFAVEYRIGNCSKNAQLINENILHMNSDPDFSGRIRRMSL